VTADLFEITIPVSDGIRLAGHLRVPPGRTGPRPGLVFTGPFTGVKEQVTGRYAAALAERGFVTLAFDHRNFGASTGEPRQHEDAAGKARDLLAATSALAAHDAVDAEHVGAVGICLGGSYAVRHAAFDSRVRALGLVAGGYNDPVAFRAGMGDGYTATLDELARLADRQAHSGDVEYLPAVDGGGGEAAMGGDEPFAYYGTARSAPIVESDGPGWVNRVTRLSIRELLTLDSVSAGPLLRPRPTLMVHGRNDAYCSPAGAQAMFDRIDGPKRLEWLDTTNHIDLYDNPRYVDPAIDLLARFLTRGLSP
jgi:uncharacterized protein